MNDINRSWTIELLWWLVTIVVTLLILLPIFNADIPFPWMYYNAGFIIGAITLIRYIFFFHLHPLAQSKLFKVFLIFLVPLIFFAIIEGLHSFIEFNDREGLQSLLWHLSVQEQSWFMKYIRIEYLLVGITCFIGGFVLIVKMIRSTLSQVRSSAD